MTEKIKPGMQINQLGEFGLIKRISQILPKAGKDVMVGIGDDVAMVHPEPGRNWLTTCDIQVEGVHFLREVITPKDLGWKAMAINLSDIASSGGRPRFAMISLGLPQNLEVSYVDELYAGISESAIEFGVDIVGGNISKSKNNLFIDIFLMGDVLPDKMVTRSGARPGDKILVSGKVGDAAAGVSLILNQELKADPVYAKKANLRRDRPTPRVKAGQVISESGLATAMVDVSDGLFGDLKHIYEMSGVGGRIYLDRMPVEPENKKLAKIVKQNEYGFALFGGEDYELLLTAREDQTLNLKRLVEMETGVPLTIIGEIVEDPKIQSWVNERGQAIQINKGSWDHFMEET